MNSQIKILSWQISQEIFYTFLACLFISIFVISTFFIPFSLPLYLLCLGFASLFILKAPEAGIYSIIICTIIFERFFTLQPIIFDENVYKIYPLDILIIITLISLIFYKIKSNHVVGSKKKFFVSSTGVLIILFVAFSFFSMIYGLALAGDLDLAFSTFKNYALYAILFFLTLNIIREKVQIKRLVNVFLFSGICLFFFIAWGFAQSRGLWTEYTPLSTAGTRYLASTHAFYLSLIVLISLIALAFRKNSFKTFAFPIILIQVIGIIASLTRHLWLALGFAVIIAFCLIPKKFKKNLIKILAVQLFFVIVVFACYSWFYFLIMGEIPLIYAEIINATKERITSFSYIYQDESSAFRIFAWEKAIEVFKQNPIIGIGFGHKLTFDFFGWPTKIIMRDLHNDFMGIIVQMGILGFLSFLLFNIAFVVQILTSFRGAVSSDKKMYLLSFFSCFVLFLISAAFGVYFDINLLVIFYWIVMGGGMASVKL